MNLYLEYGVSVQCACDKNFGCSTNGNTIGGRREKKNKIETRLNDE